MKTKFSIFIVFVLGLCFSSFFLQTKEAAAAGEPGYTAYGRGVGTNNSKYVITITAPDGSKSFAYCLEPSAAPPTSGGIGYQRYPLEEGLNLFLPKQAKKMNKLKTILFYGFANNLFTDPISHTEYLKYKNLYPTEDDYLYVETQEVMYDTVEGSDWWMPDAKGSFIQRFEAYVDAHPYNSDLKTVLLTTDNKEINQSNPFVIDKSTLKSQSFKIQSNTTVTVSLPTGVSLLNANGSVVSNNQLIPGSTYQFKVSNSATGVLSIKFGYSELGNTYIYHTDPKVSSGKFQNLIGGEVVSKTIEIPLQIEQYTEVQGEKIWQDYDNKFNTRPTSINVQLYQNGTLYDTQTVTETNGKWTYHFTELPAKDAKGKEYTYTVKEVTVPNYTTTIGTDGTITNTYMNQEKIDLTGQKIWQDYENKFQTRPEKIIVRLFQNNQEIAQKEVTADATGNWSYQFKDLAKYNAQGNEYVYTVKEDSVKDYTTTIDGTTITNTYINTEKTNLSGQKIWQDNDNKLNKRPSSIMVHLLQNGTPIKQVEVKADATGNWTYQFNDLAKYDLTGDAYQYTVKEDPVDGYSTTIDGTRITNTYENKEKTTVTGQKIWQDNNDQHHDRPTSITVRLLQNGKEIAHTEVTAGDDGQWTYEFTDLPKYDAAGDAYSYTVTEDRVENYETIIDGTTITNVYNHKGLLPETGGDKRQLIIMIGAIVLMLAISLVGVIYYQNRKGGVI